MLLYQPVAVHLLRPADTEHVHQFVAVALGLQTEAAAGQSHPAVLGTHRSVERAQKHTELWRALQVNHGMERLRADRKKQEETLSVNIRAERYRQNEISQYF